MTTIGLDKTKQFSMPWRFRAGFTANLLPDQDIKLIVTRVAGKPHAWVNGQQAASWLP
jgi:hypothetical protein